MACRVQVRTGGLTKAKRDTLTRAKRVKNLRPVMRWAADRVEEDTDRRFKAAGAYDGISAWKATKSPNPILIKTGRLYSATQKGGHGHLRRVTERTAKIGVRESHVPYYKYHQDGTANMVQRPFLHWGPASDRLFNKKLAAYIKDGRKP